MTDTTATVLGLTAASNTTPTSTTVAVTTPVTPTTTLNLGTSTPSASTGGGAASSPATSPLAPAGAAGLGVDLTTPTSGTATLTTPVTTPVVVGVTSPYSPGSAGSGGMTTSTGTSTSVGGVTVTTGGSGSGSVTVGVGSGSTSTSGGHDAGVTVGSGVPDPTSAYVNIFRLSSSAEISQTAHAQLTSIQQQIDSGAITPTQGLLKVIDMAAGDTSVAITSYQFFSGLTPTAAGVTYLEHSPDNPTDLSDSYYGQFNLENRYINFASNLGLHSDYAPQFAQDFGGLTFQQTVSVAYDRIIGTAEARAAGVDPQTAIADIASRQSYFQAVAHERFGNDNQDLSTKLAAVAYIMEESVRADVGRYGNANQNFLFDLADGKAQHHVDLVGTYGYDNPTNMTT